MYVYVSSLFLILSQSYLANSYLFFLEILCVQLQGVELNGERARVPDDDLGFNLSADREARPQLQHRRAEIELRLLALPLGC